jgi:hypothetical protein
MFVLMAKALSGRELIEKHDRAEDAYTKARSWISVGFTEVRLSQEGGPWYYGAEQIRAFIDNLSPVDRIMDRRPKPGQKGGKNPDPA